MTKKELKEIIKECLKEMLFEEKGVLSNVIEEVMKAQGKTLVTENKAETETRKMIKNMYSEAGLMEALTPANKLQQRGKTLPDTSPVVKQVSKQFGGLNPFAGTAPIDD
jgi:polyphosphate kinase